MIKKKIIAGEVYLRISDVAKISHTNIRTLQRWVNRGDLVNFLTTYQSKRGINYFRLGVPHEYDKLIPGSKFKYQLPDDDLHLAGVNTSNKNKIESEAKNSMNKGDMR